jgi:hypothetical protein
MEKIHLGVYKNSKVASYYFFWKKFWGTRKKSEVAGQSLLLEQKSPM